jgi:hypothetical protein
MKIRVVSLKDEITSLNSDEQIVHLAFRPSDKDIFALVKTCPRIKAIHIPGSYQKTVSKSIKMFLEIQNIKLLEGDVWGHRKDINEYYEIKKSVIDRINDLKNEGMNEKEIVKKMKKETRLSDDLIKFLIKS